MKFLFKVLFFILLIFGTSFAKVRIGMFPLDFRAPSDLDYLKGSLTQIILDKLSSPPQVEVFFLTEPVSKRSVDYFLLFSVYVTENRIYLDCRVFKETPSKPYISYQEEGKISEIESMVASLSGKLRERLYEESKPLWSKINFFRSLEKPSLSFLFKKEKYRVEIPVPPPVPPPLYSYPRTVEMVPRVSEETSSSPSKKAKDLKSPWQWF